MGKPIMVSHLLGILVRMAIIGLPILLRAIRMKRRDKALTQAQLNAAYMVGVVRSSGWTHSFGCGVLGGCGALAGAGRAGCGVHGGRGVQVQQGLGREGLLADTRSGALVPVQVQVPGGDCA